MKTVLRCVQGLMWCLSLSTASYAGDVYELEDSLQFAKDQLKRLQSDKNHTQKRAFDLQEMQTIEKSFDATDPKRRKGLQISGNQFVMGDDASRFYYAVTTHAFKRTMKSNEPGEYEDFKATKKEFGYWAGQFPQYVLWNRSHLLGTYDSSMDVLEKISTLGPAIQMTQYGYVPREQRLMWYIDAVEKALAAGGSDLPHLLLIENYNRHITTLIVETFERSWKDPVSLRAAVHMFLNNGEVFSDRIAELDAFIYRNRDIEGAVPRTEQEHLHKTFVEAVGLLKSDVRLGSIDVKSSHFPIPVGELSEAYRLIDPISALTPQWMNPTELTLEAMNAGVAMIAAARDGWNARRNYEEYRRIMCSLNVFRDQLAKYRSEKPAVPAGK